MKKHLPLLIQMYQTRAYILVPGVLVRCPADVLADAATASPADRCTRCAFALPAAGGAQARGRTLTFGSRRRTPVQKNMGYPVGASHIFGIYYTV